MHRSQNSRQRDIYWKYAPTVLLFVLTSASPARLALRDRKPFLLFVAGASFVATSFGMPVSFRHRPPEGNAEARGADVDGWGLGESTLDGDGPSMGRVVGSEFGR